MKKILIVATVVKKHIMQFHIPIMKLLKENGWEITVAARNDYDDASECNIPYCDEYIDVQFERFPFHPENISAYKSLKKIIKEGNFDIIHCHTPVGGVLARLAAKSMRKKGVRVFYTAHGFHFCENSPISNWLLYYPVEKFLSRFTDVLVTINSEDYNLAKNKFHAKKTVFINGVGVDTRRFQCVEADKAGLCAELGIDKDAILLLSVGELTDRKNHKTIISALKSIEDKNVHYLIAGDGEKRFELENMAKSFGLGKRVHLLGYRKVSNIIKSCDIFCFPSEREGLPVALMEAMAGGLPVVASNVRGNRDLITQGKGGFLYNPDDVKGFFEGIKKLEDSEKLRAEFGLYNMQEVKKYDVSYVLDELQNLYF